MLFCCEMVGWILQVKAKSVVVLGEGIDRKIGN